MQFDPHDIDALLAFHRAAFGDARMEDEPEPDEPQEGTDDAGSGDDPEPFDEVRAKAALTKKNGENKSLRDRLKAAEPMLAELQALKDKDKSESEKLAEREKTLTERESRVMRLEIALDKGLTAAQAKRLVGSTQEELEADADELLAEFGKPSDEKPAPKVPGKPTERLRGGNDPSQEPEETDPAKLAARIPRY